jgi:ADP-ribose pyrophosphatase
VNQPPSTFPDHPVVAVGAVVFKNNRVLLVRRGHAPAKGQWAIPGGRIKLGETLQAGAEREIMEETGILVKAKDPVDTLDSIHRSPDGRVRYHYVIVDLVADYISGEPVAGDDADEVRWISYDELLELPVNQGTLDLLVNRLGFGK